MEIVRSVPQIFFDFFARMTPGFYLLAILEITSPEPGLWQKLLTSLAAGKLLDSNVFAFALGGSIVAAWIGGQLLSPFAKWIDKIGYQVEANTWKRYDWLRLHKPEAGAFTVRIRAEYTMFNSMSAASLVGAIYSGYIGRWCFLVACIAIAIILWNRAAGVRQTFSNSVNNFSDIANQTSPPSAS